jgi:hypothetical protein
VSWPERTLAYQGQGHAAGKAVASRPGVAPSVSAIWLSCREVVVQVILAPEPRPCAPQHSKSRPRDDFPVRVDVRCRRVSEWGDDAADV